jgi:protein-disulfide isomerase
MDTTRRAFLATAGAAAATTGLAGCLGGGGGGVGNCETTARPPVSQLATPVLGEQDAPALVETFEDYACPHCATFEAEVIPELRSDYFATGAARWAFHDFPIPVSEQWSWGAANAANAVMDSADPSTFFEYSGALFENQDSFSMNRIQRLADEAGADGCTARSAAVNSTYEQVIRADRQRGLNRNVQGTPSVFVNGRQVRPSYNAIANAIEAQQ